MGGHGGHGGKRGSVEVEVGHGGSGNSGVVEMRTAVGATVEMEETEVQGDRGDLVVTAVEVETLEAPELAAIVESTRAILTCSI